jgi:metal-responsive CopG/Arc/MetJ family transcriptional regulator
MNSQTFNISMPKQLVERIDAQTKRQGSSRSDFVRLAVRKQLAILEQWDSLSNKVRSQYKDKQLSEDEVVKVVRSYRAK